MVGRRDEVGRQQLFKTGPKLRLTGTCVLQKGGALGGWLGQRLVEQGFFLHGGPRQLWNGSAPELLHLPTGAGTIGLLSGAATGEYFFASDARAIRLNLRPLGLGLLCSPLQ
jgi:hypothetical protein